MNSLIRLKTTLSIGVVLAFGCFAFSPMAQAVVPAPDGGYPGGNTAEGASALLSLTTGTFNTAVGFFSLRSNTEGDFNTAIGAGALLANTADNNTAAGAAALLSNTTGSANTANGESALFSNTEGSVNTANGVEALFSNTTGDANTAVGGDALFSNSTGNNNTATGDNALVSNTTGISNTAIGVQALQGNATGNNNVALGAAAGFNVTTASNVICIGATVGGANLSNSCFIGNIRGVTTANGNAIPVLIDSAGQLGTMSSSRQFKKEIKPMDKASESILGLKPVTFHYKSDSKGTAQFGLIAEEVAEVDPDLVIRDKDGEIYTVRYDAVNAMLLNEFLKAHDRMQQLEKQVEKLTARLQTVSDQLELGKPASQLVDNDQ